MVVNSEIHVDHIKILNSKVPNVLSHLGALLYVVRKFLPPLGQWTRVLGENSLTEIMTVREVSNGRRRSSAAGAGMPSKPQTVRGGRVRGDTRDGITDYSRGVTGRIDT
jgi:hypothetical protein